MYTPDKNLVTPSYGSFDELIQDSDSFLSALEYFFELPFLFVFIRHIQILFVPESQIEDVVCECINDLPLVVSNRILYLNQVRVPVVHFQLSSQAFIDLSHSRFLLLGDFTAFIGYIECFSLYFQSFGLNDFCLVVENTLNSLVRIDNLVGESVFRLALNFTENMRVTFDSAKLS